MTNKKSSKITLATQINRLKTMDLNDIKELEGKNALVIISNGQMKAAELPKFGIVEITSHDEKVTFVEQKIKSKF
jgi:hypothetical protein